jgi:hypothetical protein
MSGLPEKNRECKQRQTETVDTGPWSVAGGNHPAEDSFVNHIPTLVEPSHTHATAFQIPTQDDLVIEEIQEDATEDAILRKSVQILATTEPNNGVKKSHECS